MRAAGSGIDIRPSAGRVLPVVLAAVAVGAAVPTFMLLVRAWGHRIPNPVVEADYLIGLCWALLLGASILAWPVPTRDKPPLLVLWIVKSLVTLGAMLLYEWHYDLDTFGYFEHSLSLVSPLDQVVWGDGTRNMNALVWLHGRVMPASFHAMKVSFAMLGLIAVYLFYRGTVRVLGSEDRRLLYLFGLYPSILFWSSILGKDPVQFLGIALYAYGVMSWRTSGSWLYAIPVAAGIALASFIRIWAGIILVVPLIVFVLRGLRGVGSRVVFLVLTVGALAWAGEGLAARFSVASVADIVTTAEVLQQGWDGGSALQTNRSFTSLGGMIAFAPVGAFTALFRPLPGEVLNPFGLLAGIENLGLLILLGFAVAGVTRKKLAEPLVQWALVLIGVWAAMHGFVSYHNLGAAVRFKLQVLPLMIWLLIHLARRPVLPAGPATEERG
jgi:hypothetical protein